MRNCNNNSICSPQKIKTSVFSCVLTVCPVTRVHTEILYGNSLAFELYRNFTFSVFSVKIMRSKMSHLFGLSLARWSLVNSRSFFLKKSARQIIPCQWTKVRKWFVHFTNYTPISKHGLCIKSVLSPESPTGSGPAIIITAVISERYTW